jgi:hypothetical protein
VQVQVQAKRVVFRPLAARPCRMGTYGVWSECRHLAQSPVASSKCSTTSPQPPATGVPGRKTENPGPRRMGSHGVGMGPRDGVGVAWGYGLRVSMVPHGAAWGMGLARGWHRAGMGPAWGWHGVSTGFGLARGAGLAWDMGPGPGPAQKITRGGQGPGTRRRLLFAALAGVGPTTH